MRIGSKPRTRRVVVGAVAACLAVGGYAALDIADVAPGVLTTDSRSEAPQAPDRPDAPDAPDAPGAPGAPGDGSRVDAGQSPVARAPMPLAALSSAAPVPRTASLARRLTAASTDPAIGGSVGIDVRDALTGRTLFTRGAAVPRTAASTTKLLTAAAITHATDPARTFETRVVTGAGPGDVVLVAGGDTLLAPGRGDPGAVAGRAGIADLARQVAAALHRTGTSSVRVHLDDRYARGPATAPGWAAGDVAAGITGPVVMLGTTDARATPGHPAPADPALHAAASFAAELGENGIDVIGRPDRRPAAAGATELGSVRSAPRGDVLALALDESDNALTESLARSAAVEQGVRPTFADVATWVRRRLVDQGIPVGRVTLVDTSGLSRATRIPTSVVTDVLTLGTSGKSPAFADVVARLPVAGLSGTLHDRFLGADARAATGVARAKTGTLTGVHGLAGTVVDADGRLLVYAVLADRAGGTPAARAALDRLIASLAACGCR